MRVLVACEYSGIVRDAFIKAGHFAMSCDLLPTESPGPHHEGDVKALLSLDTGPWDLMVAHPPCTYLAVSGARWLTNPDGSRNLERVALRDEALDFVRFLMDAPIPRICIENPLSMISGHIRKSDQMIHHYHFGAPVSKGTCLWLKNLPKLEHGEVVEAGPWPEFLLGPQDPDRKKKRSRFFVGIATAMAEQWGSLDD